MLEKYMRKELLALLPEIMFQPIESGDTGIGIPDIWYGYRKISGWIELKELTKVPRYDIIEIPWRPGQLNWYNKYCKKVSEKYFLLLTIKDNWYVMNKLNIFECYAKKELARYFLCETKDLINNRSVLKALLL